MRNIGKIIAQTIIVAGLISTTTTVYSMNRWHSRMNEGETRKLAEYLTANQMETIPQASGFGNHFCDRKGRRWGNTGDNIGSHALKVKLQDGDTPENFSRRLIDWAVQALTRKNAIAEKIGGNEYQIVCTKGSRAITRCCVDVNNTEKEAEHEIGFVFSKGTGEKGFSHFYPISTDKVK
jgi:hypothetical protein